jgi:hypothetical protein
MAAVRLGTNWKIKERPFASLCGLLLAALLARGSFAAKPGKNHQDWFVPGPADETRIAKEVRHQLLPLPYYGVFDDLAFKIEGDTVTLVGATANPVLKSDAARADRRSRISSRNCSGGTKNGFSRSNQPIITSGCVRMMSIATLALNLDES